jgi:hypothetical protein
MNILRDVLESLKRSRCLFCEQHVEDLGHTISSNGIVTDPKKTEAIGK